MADNEISRVGKLLNSQVAKNARAFVKDAGMQRDVPVSDGTMKSEKSPSFKGVLKSYLDEVNTLQHEADAQIQRLAAGETEDLHEVVLAMDEADTAFDMMMEIRNKLVKSYQEIMKMQT